MCTPGGESVEDNADSFAVLVEEGILPGRVERAAAGDDTGPRLVNVYWDVDDGRIQDSLREGLADTESFVERHRRPRAGSDE